MRYKIFSREGALVNTIVAPDDLFVKNYCAKRGYGYEVEAEEPYTPPESPTPEDIILDTLADHEYRLCLTELSAN